MGNGASIEQCKTGFLPVPSTSFWTTMLRKRAVYGWWKNIAHLTHSTVDNFVWDKIQLAYNRLWPIHVYTLHERKKESCCFFSSVLKSDMEAFVCHWGRQLCKECFPNSFWGHKYNYPSSWIISNPLLELTLQMKVEEHQLKTFLWWTGTQNPCMLKLTEKTVKKTYCCLPSSCR